MRARLRKLERKLTRSGKIEIDEFKQDSYRVKINNENANLSTTYRHIEQNPFVYGLRNYERR